VALPVWHGAGGTAVGDALYDRILHPTAGRLLQHCDAVLRLPGDSKGADEDVRVARERGLPVFFDIAEVPAAS
jgi:3-phosphoglycerate kinase